MILYYRVLVVVFALGCVIYGFRRTHDSERLLVFRLGRVQRLAGPGVVWLLPLVDVGVRFDLDRVVPAWRSLSNDEIIARLVQLQGRPGSV